MFGSSDDNRSQDQGGAREGLSTKEGGGKRAAAGRQTGSEAGVRAMSVRENAKSNRHRKTHPVEPGGASGEFMHLTRGGLWRESAGEVSRGRSSEDSRGNTVGAKGRRNRQVRSTGGLRPTWRRVPRNDVGAATTATSRAGAPGGSGWTPRQAGCVRDKSWAGRIPE